MLLLFLSLFSTVLAIPNVGVNVAVNVSDCYDVTRSMTDIYCPTCVVYGEFVESVAKLVFHGLEFRAWYLNGQLVQNGFLTHVMRVTDETEGKCLCAYAENVYVHSDHYACRKFVRYLSVRTNVSCSVQASKFGEECTDCPTNVSQVVFESTSQAMYQRWTVDGWGIFSNKSTEIVPVDGRCYCVWGCDLKLCKGKCYYETCESRCYRFLPYHISNQPPLLSFHQITTIPHHSIIRLPHYYTNSIPHHLPHHHTNLIPHHLINSLNTAHPHLENCPPHPFQLTPPH